ncbi:MAG: hypothetical protein ACR2M1_04425 [Gemmatimonadaceae bacterium]
MSIPVISPIEITLRTDATARLLPAGTPGEDQEPDYTVQELSAPQPAVITADPAVMALNEIEDAAAVSEYHDFEWWRTRIAAIRSVLDSRVQSRS